MKIQVGNIVMNRTKKYLVPVLKDYGPEFETMYTSIFKLAIGIGDIVTTQNNMYLLDKNLFVLVDCNMFPEAFNAFQIWIRRQDHIYQDDYAFDDILTGHLHMFVIKFPEDYLHIYETFKKSAYSKMYTKEELEMFFKEDNEVVKIVVKDHSYKVKFAKKLSEEFDVKGLTADDINDNYEFDLPVDNKDEIFNLD